MAGEVASTVLSRMAVPVLYYVAEKRKRPGNPALECEVEDRQEVHV
jgi:hypothetical protein